MTLDDPGRDDCCGHGEQFTWCPAFAEWLCAHCQWVLTERELRPTQVLPPPPPMTVTGAHP